jgi:hypothetical protein
MKLDHNVLEQRAGELIRLNKPDAAIRIYFYMAEGDTSFDGGYLAEKIAQCYEKMNAPYAAKYWYELAVKENPEAREISSNALKRLGGALKIDDLM